MLMTVAIEVDDVVQAVVRNLLAESDGGHLHEEDEYDEFSDPGASRRRPASDTR
jgi:hypothetical protein